MDERFITGSATVEQNENGKWQTMHNQLYCDAGEQIYLVPRNTETDGYSYPLGGRMASWDIRPAIGHDFECRFHQKIFVNLTLFQLIQMGYVKNKDVKGKGIVICENIPVDFLELRKTGFIETNARFKRMMDACGISRGMANIMFGAVHLNLRWMRTGKPPFDLSQIYKR